MGAAGAETPICTSVLICEKIITDAQTGSLSLIGIYSQVHVPRLPGWISFNTFFSLTNGKGDVNLRLVIEQDNGDRLLEIGGPMQIPTPRDIIDHNVRIERAPVQQEGIHWVSIYCDEELLGRRPFLVTLATGGSQP